MPTNQITIDGNLTADPELTIHPDGYSIANFRIAHTPRVYDRDTKEYRDGKTTFVNCRAWRTLAENIVQSLHRGDRILAVGHLVIDEWEKDGQRHTFTLIELTTCGAALEFATADIRRNERQ